MAYTNEALGKALEDLTGAYNNFVMEAKTAAIAAMGDTVIAEVKQDAKDHISAELAAQKTALEQAIETGKSQINSVAAQAGVEIAAVIQTKEQDLQVKVNDGKAYIDGQLSAASQGLQDSINTKVTAAVSTAEAALLAKINTKFIEHYKNGYIQWPGMPSPLEDESLHFEGYSWHEVNYDGNFFRAKGRNAKAFSAKKLTKEQIKNGAYAFEADEQGDAIRNIKGSFARVPVGPYDEHFFDGLFSKKSHGNLPWVANEMASFSVTFNAANAPGVSVAEENRSRNLTFTFWVLVKNE